MRGLILAVLAEVRSLTVEEKAQMAEKANATRLREAVFRLSDLFKFAPSVRDAAVDALGDRDFASVIKNDTVVPHTASNFGKAYILLRSIKEEAEASSGAGSSSGAVADHATHIQRVNMSNFNVDDMVAQMRQLLPKTGAQGSALSAHDAEGDDEFEWLQRQMV